MKEVHTWTHADLEEHSRASKGCRKAAVLMNRVSSADILREGWDAMRGQACGCWLNVARTLGARPIHKIDDLDKADAWFQIGRSLGARNTAYAGFAV